MLGVLGVWHWKVWQGPMSQPKGVSDILGAYKGRMLAIEVKRPGKIPTPDQQRFLDRVKIEGGISFVAHSVDETMEQLTRQGGDNGS
jgi:penicillin-binding protein-related factor A (putative recombinase)